MHRLKSSLSQLLKRLFWSIYGRWVLDAVPHVDTTKTVKAFLDIIDIIPSQRTPTLLDAGCGTGNFALALAQAGFQVTGVDFAKGMLHRARAKIIDDVSARLTFLSADLAARLPFPDNSFEYVLSVSSLQIVPDPPATLHEFQRVLSENGTLILLHIPRPEWHKLPFISGMRRHLRNSNSKSPLRIILVLLKGWAERTGQAQYWTTTELVSLIETSGFKVFYLDAGPPILISAANFQMSSPRSK